MHPNRRHLLILTAFALAGCGGGESTVAQDAPASDAMPASLMAVYRVTLRSYWTEAAFPTRFPPGAHLTGIVGATHGDAVEFWAPGRVATQGIQDVAERGAKPALLAEVAQAIAAGTAEFALSGGGVPFGAAEVSLDFTISTRQPRVTLVSMLGPSPDWFVGVAGLSLMRAGQWQQRIELPLRVWDAGTDDGARFMSGNAVTSPRGVVLALSSAAADSDLQDGLHRNAGASLASIVFERQS